MSAWPELVQFLRQHRLEPTLSVYVEALPADPGGDRAAELRLRDVLTRLAREMEDAPPLEKGDFDAATDALGEALPSADRRSRTMGWAFFRTSGGAQLVVPVPAGIETAASWGMGPRVVPFLRASTPQSALVVQVDRQHARFSLLHDGIVEEIVTIDADPVTDVGTHMSAGPALGFHSGTHGRAGADEAQRQRREATERLFSSVVKRSLALSDDHLPVLVGGPTESVTRVLAAFPASLEARSCDAPELRMEDPNGKSAALLAALRRLRDRQQRERVTALREDVRERRRAAAGYDEAFRAAERGAIAELIFGDDAWRARPDAIEFLVHRALAAGATVQWAPPGVLNDETGAADGIIAGLRFPLESSARDTGREPR